MAWDNRPGSNLIFTMVGLLLLSALLPLPLWAAEGTKRWEFPAEGTIRSSPAIGPDGTIYVGSDDGKVYAVQPDGTKKWEFPTGGAVSSSPVVGYFGGVLRIYVGSEDKMLYAIDSDGNKIWAFQTGGIISSSPAISNSGIIYVGSEDEKVYAIKVDGTAETGEWPLVTQGKVTSSPAVGSDGTLYVGSGDHNLYARKSTGREKWTYTGSTAAISSSPAIGSDGTIYVGSEDGKVYAIDPETGAIKTGWPFTTGGPISSSPAVGNDEIVFVGSDDTELYAILSTGQEKWGFRTPMAAISSSPAIGSDGTIIYVGSDDGNLYAIDSETGDIRTGWPFITGGAVSSSPTIGFGGDVYVGSEDGKLYAIESASSRLANVSWPKFNHDVRNTARNNTNVGPTPVTGPDQTVKSGDTVTLNGSNSSDPDYGIPLYAWTQTEGTSVTLSDSTAVKPTFAAPTVDGDKITLTFDLTVTDNAGETETAICTITVEKKDDDKGCFISTARGGVGY